MTVPLFRITLLAALSCALLNAAASAQPSRERSDFEAWLDTAPALSLARAEADLLAREVDELADRGGWRLFGGVTGAHVDEIEQGTDNRVYERLQGDIGLEYPLLGRQRGQAAAVLDREAARLVAEGEARARRLAVQTQLSEAYAEYWVAHRSLTLADRWYRLLDARLPMLESEVGTLFLASDLADLRAARRMVDTQRALDRIARQTARERMQRLLGRPIEPFQPVWPGQGPVCDRLSPLQTAVARLDPRIAARRAVLDRRLDAPLPAFSDVVDAGFVIQHSRLAEDDQLNDGEETRIGLSFSMPLAVNRAAAHYRARRNAELSAARERLNALRETRLADVARAVSDLRESRYQRAVSERRLADRRRAWREAQRRTAMGGVEADRRALQRGSEWYSAARERLTTERAWLLARARLEPISPASCQATPASPLDAETLDPAPAGSDRGNADAVTP